MNIDSRVSRAFTLAITATLWALVMVWPTGAGAQVGDLISSSVISKAEQEELGLVSVAGVGTCTGTLLNQYWVLTSDRCLVHANNHLDYLMDPGGPEIPLEQLTITATWHSGTVTPTRSVRYWNSNHLDVALLFLGDRNFGSRDRKTRLIYHNPVDTSMTLTKFGDLLAAKFTPSTANETIVTFSMPEAGAAMYGNSGAPDYVTGADGAILSIASVTSKCATPLKSSWCNSTPLFAIRDDILRIIKEVPPPPDSGIVSNQPDVEVVLPKPDADIVSKPHGADAVLTNPNRDEIVANRPGVTVSAYCKSGFVWRLARPEDHVCVTADVRSRTARENEEAQSHVNPTGAYGPNTCISGYVWREAFEGDQVCVTPEVRELVSQENADASSHTQ